jgi:hypothetical protein
MAGCVSRQRVKIKTAKVGLAQSGCFIPAPAGRKNLARFPPRLNRSVSMQSDKNCSVFQGDSQIYPKVGTLKAIPTSQRLL